MALEVVTFGCRLNTYESEAMRRAGRKVTVTLPGGDLLIEWREADDHVLMTGPVEYEFAGRFDPALFAAGVS